MGRADPYPLDRYLDASRTLSLDEYDWSRATAHPLDPDVERSMVFMLRIEAQTLFYVRDLLNSRTAFVPGVGAFMAVWLYEEERHSRIFRRFLAERGIVVPEEDRAAVRRASVGGPREWIEATFVKWFGHVSDHVIAVHMTWGAYQELSTIHGYELLGSRSNHPFLKELCDSIAKDERRHFAFYFNQAARHLDSPRAQKLVRGIIKHYWKPVGFGIHSPQHVHQFIEWLFGDAEGQERFRQMDETLGKLPGMAGLDAFTTFLWKGKKYIADRESRGLDFEDWTPMPKRGARSNGGMTTLTAGAALAGPAAGLAVARDESA